MFEKKGEIRVKSPAEGEARQSRQESRVKSQEEEELELIDLGAEDIESFEEDGLKKYLVYTEATKIAEVGTKITQLGYEVESKELVFKPTVMQEIKDPGLVKKVIEFAEMLEEQD